MTLDEKIRSPVGMLRFFLLGFFALGLALHSDAGIWRGMLDEIDAQGSFSTSHSRYFHAHSEGVTKIYRWMSIIEIVPQDDYAAEVVALNIAQQPDARSVLIIGEGSHSICEAFGQLPSIEVVTWLTQDPAYPGNLRRILEPKDRGMSSKIFTPEIDIGEYLSKTEAEYDIVLINLRPPNTVARSRYFSEAFYSLLLKIMRDDAVVSVRIRHIDQGFTVNRELEEASIYSTMRKVFPHIAIKPGWDSWLIASRSDHPHEGRRRLQRNFESVPDSSDLYDPEKILGLYHRASSEHQRSRYTETIERVGERQFVNTQHRPRALMYALMLKFHGDDISDQSIERWIMFARLGLLWILSALALYVIFRSVSKGGGWSARWDRGLLSTTAGISGLILPLVIIFEFQARFGSLYRHVGLLALFFVCGIMLGWSGLRFVSLPRGLRRGLLTALIPIHAALCLLAIDLLANGGMTTFLLMMFSAGAVLGSYSPLIFPRTDTKESSSRKSAVFAKLCIFAACAVGVAIAGILLIPFLGVRQTLIIAAAMLAVNLPALLLEKRSQAPTQRESWVDRLTRRIGVAMLWSALLALVISNSAYFSADKTAEQRARLYAATEQMAPGSELVDAVLADGSTVQYYQDPKNETIVLSTESLAPGVRGYNDTIDMAVKLSSEGEILDLRVIRHFETPSYMRDVVDWLSKLRGRNIFRENIAEQVDAVSGATASSEAILRSLQITGSRLSDTEGVTEQVPVLRVDWSYDKHFLFIAGMTFIALILRAHPQTRLRKLQLLGIMLVGGFMFNTQYSLDNILGLLGGQIPPIALQGGFIMTVGVPVLVLLFGNIYCGHLCPFGAMQELLYDAKPRRFRLAPDKSLWSIARWIKYLALFALIMMYAASRSREIGDADPLVSAFGTLGHLLVPVTLGILILAIFFNRFWCRNLCPVGAFLSILNRVKLLRFLKFRIYPGHCDLGVRNSRESDCINCDRCRMPDAGRPRASKAFACLLILTAVIFAIIWCSRSF